MICLWVSYGYGYGYDMIWLRITLNICSTYAQRIPKIIPKSPQNYSKITQNAHPGAPWSALGAFQTPWSSLEVLQDPSGPPQGPPRTPPGTPQEPILKPPGAILEPPGAILDPPRSDFGAPEKMRYEILNRMMVSPSQMDFILISYESTLSQKIDLVIAIRMI